MMMMKMMMINRRLASKSSLRFFSNSSINSESSFLVNHGSQNLEIITSSALHGRKHLSFPNNEGDLLPMYVSGPCNGQFCVYSDWQRVSLLNPGPATADIKHFTLPRWNNFHFADVHGLGLWFDSKTNDFKIVRSITCDFWDHKYRTDNLSYRGNMFHYIEVYSLSTMERREIPVLGEIRCIRPSGCCVPTVDGVCYWSAKDSHDSTMRLVSFDFADEVFDVFTLPNGGYLNYDPNTENCLMGTLNGLPAAIRYDDASADKLVEVWVKRESWVKEKNIGPVSGVIKPLCFLNNDGLVFLDSEYQLVVYDFGTKQLKKLDIKLSKPIESEDGKHPMIQVFDLTKQLMMR